MCYDFITWVSVQVEIMQLVDRWTFS